MNTRQSIGSLLAAATIWAIAAGCSGSAQNEVAKLLAYARLSPLPASATNVAYHQWRGLFGGAVYAKFEVSQADLRAFISNSFCLQITQPQKVYNTNYHHVLFPRNEQEWDFEHCDYFQRYSNAPAWYDPTIRGNGRKYEIDVGSYVEILVDEDRNIVWLRLVD